MVQLRSIKLFKTSSKSNRCARDGKFCNRIEWELRPGGLLVQKREAKVVDDRGLITVRVSTGLDSHNFTIDPTATFGKLKELVAAKTGMEPGEQRLLFKGKEREDEEHLHMIGVKDGNKVLLFVHPMAIRVLGLGVQRREVDGHRPASIEA
ncbi:hypothetical protein HPP92_016392 [Vanilla planifolia]|uniref:Ubiquitin-like domain-containing protein n=1 Tax=Vanilla planifolia TaxID=51239 RepID=A0A835QEP0_VANPL|nr:hypothetical protein HPP92_016392 [Vanilla planifolia]